jgi:hypothetical protein
MVELDRAAHLEPERRAHASADRAIAHPDQRGVVSGFSLFKTLVQFHSTLQYITKF